MSRKLINPYATLHQGILQTSGALRAEDLGPIRKQLIWAYSWAVPSDEVIHAIAALGPVIEFGCGTGYWSWLLSQAGADVIATDHEPGQPPWWISIRGSVDLSADELRERTLLLCWPPLDSPMASEALAAFRGRRVVYVGEWEGRTADRAFHQRLSREFRRVREIEIPRWPGFEDRAYFFER